MSRRTEKVAELIKRQVSEMVKKSLPEEMGLVTITEVILTEDLKSATIYFSILPEENFKPVFQELENNKLKYQRQLGKILEMKYTPKIIFKIDQGFDEVNKVEAILKKIAKK